MGRPVASCSSLARTLPPPSPPGPLGMSRAPVGGHTDADTRGHTPHERTPPYRGARVAMCSGVTVMSTRGSVFQRATYASTSSAAL
jgi:hypothetical protein